MQSIFDNHIVKLDSQRFFLPLMVFALLSIFLHLLLHNYDRLQENNLDHHNHTSSFSTLPLDNNKLMAEINPPLLEGRILPESDITTKNTLGEIKNPLVQRQKSPKIIESKKLGNVTVVAVKKNTNLSEVVKLGSYQGANAISNALVKNKQNLSLEKGDLLQITENKLNKKHNLKIVIQNKSVIKLQKSKKDYKISLSKPEKKKPAALQSKIVTHALTYNELLNRNHQIPSNIKLDLLKLHSLLKKNGLAPYKYQVAYKNSRSAQLLFLDVHSGKGIKKIYKFKDKNGIANFVEADGSLIIESKPLVQKFSLSYPIANPTIGSGFGMRKHPILGCNKMHKGMDFRARRGTPIYAPADGIIVNITNSKGFGKNVRIRHNNVYTTLYGHLDAFANKKIGNRIHKGEVIGFVGKTGLASGEHLHFELHENGRPINPMQMIAPSRKVPNNRLMGKDLRAFKSYTSQLEAEVKLL